jgi:hypothetical protein
MQKVCGEWDKKLHTNVVQCHVACCKFDSVLEFIGAVGAREGIDDAQISRSQELYARSGQESWELPTFVHVWMKNYTPEQSMLMLRKRMPALCHIFVQSLGRPTVAA